MKAPTRRSYVPPIVITVVHSQSSARCEVRVLARQGAIFEVEWPMSGIVGFSRASGAGTGRVSKWRMDPEDLRALRDDPSYQPTAPRERKTPAKRPTKTEQLDPKTQLPLFGGAP